jgi:hypothetical protein
MQLLPQLKSNSYYIFQKCGFVDLGIPYVMHMGHTLICDLSTLSQQRHRFGGRGFFTENKTGFDFLHICPKYFSF